MEDIKQDLLADLKLEQSTTALDYLASGQNKYLKDFRLNFKSILKANVLSELETSLIGLALAYNTKNDHLKAFFDQKAKDAEATDEHISDAIACASLLSANNIFYRFRHFVEGDRYDKSPAKFRMSIMMKSSIGKELFELISLAVSAVNGCEICVSAHEKSLRELQVSEEKIWESIRIASMVESADRLL